MITGELIEMGLVSIDGLPAFCARSNDETIEFLLDKPIGIIKTNDFLNDLFPDTTERIEFNNYRQYNELLQRLFLAYKIRMKKGMN